jgi:dipeptidyl aminopeptidase/acylaminoacyl peptidase
MNRKSLLVVCLILLIASTSFSQEKRNFTIEELFKYTRVSDPQISPDGKWIAYVVNIIDKEKNRGNSDIWIIASTGGTPRKLTTSEKSDDKPRWSPDGKSIAFQSTRDGSSQIYIININGGEARKITSLPNGTSNHIWTSEGKSLIFQSTVYPDCYTSDWTKDKECNTKKEDEKSKSKVKARVIDELMYKHWNTWIEETRSHIFMTSIDGKEVKQLTNGNYTVPPLALGGIEDVQISPDGKEIAFSTNMDKNIAWSTNNDIFVIPTAGGEPKQISVSGGADVSPRYSPNGNYIAYRSQKTPMYEADLWRILLYNRKTGETTILTDGTNFDNWVDDLIWSPDSKTIYFTAEVKGNIPIYSVNLKREVKELAGGPYWHENVRLSKDGKFLAFTRREISYPNEVYTFVLKDKIVKRVTDVNNNFLSEVKLAKGEEVWFDGAAGKVQGWIVKPPDFNPKKKYPLLLIIHGGPQQMLGNAFRGDWQVFPAAGYVVMFTNPEGSTGYGQKFVEAISKDWGGNCYNSLMNAVDYAVSLGYIDEKKMTAYGGSFGGYMVNWILGKTNRFAALITHAGAYNLEAKYGTTEELWFPEWEFAGTPWENPELYKKWSPHYLAENFKTPMLITHGELDFRVPVQQGMELFTALQRQNVPSKFLWFPDEGHWIMKPQNNELWYKTMIDWLNEWGK